MGFTDHCGTCNDPTVVEWVEEDPRPFDRVDVRERWHLKGHPMSLDEYYVEDLNEFLAKDEA